MASSSYSIEIIFTSIFMITVSVVAVIGNFLVILAILWNKRLRTVCNFLFLNLAVADMLQGAIAMPLRLADQLNQTDNSPLIPCLVVIPLTVFLFGASNFNLTLISLDRYFALRWPFIHPTLAEPRRAGLIVAIFWVLMFIIAFLPIIGWGAADTADVTDICLYSTTLSREYLFMLFSIVNLAVVIILAFTNYFILKTARSQIRRINVNESHSSAADGQSSVVMETESVMVVSTVQSTNDTNNEPAQVPRARGGGKERRATKIVLIVVGIFVFLTTPITVIDIISLLGCPTCTPLTLVKITVFMAYANACVNVFIYAGFNTEMRNTWIAIFRRAKQAILSRFSGEEAM
ncbi:adenosine receptor A1-like [Oculina patagonica]